MIELSEDLYDYIQSFHVSNVYTEGNMYLFNMENKCHVDPVDWCQMLCSSVYQWCGTDVVELIIIYVAKLVMH